MTNGIPENLPKTKSKKNEFAPVISFAVIVNRVGAGQVPKSFLRLNSQYVLTVPLEIYVGYPNPISDSLGHGRIVETVSNSGWVSLCVGPGVRDLGVNYTKIGEMCLFRSFYHLFARRFFFFFFNENRSSRRNIKCQAACSRKIYNESCREGET